MLASIIEADAAPEIRIEILRQLSADMGTLDNKCIERFPILSDAWFPPPHTRSLPSWHSITSGLIKQMNRHKNSRKPALDKGAPETQGLRQ